MNTERLRLLVESLGGTLDVLEGGDYVADLPAGRQWIATGGHTISAASERHSGTTPLDARRALAADVRLGVQSCNDRGCDVCTE